MPPLQGKRILLLGAEGELGRATADALQIAGGKLAVVAARSDAESAFGVQRLARRLGALSQAIDATNESAVRVMVRQLSKDLGGLDGAVSCVEDAQARELFERHARKEMKRTGAGIYVDATACDDVVAALSVAD